MNNAYIRAQQCKVKEAKFPFVKIGEQYWTTKNLSLVVTPQGNTIPEMQANGNVEKVVNGGFDTDTIWTKQTGWSINGGVCSSNLAIGSIFQSGGVIGKWYRCTYTITSISAGYMYIFAGSTGIGIKRITAGTYTEYLQSSGSGSLGINASSTCIGSVDNISIQEIGWSGSQELYDGIYAQTSGTVEQKTYAAVKAAAMWCNYNNDAPTGLIYGKLYNWFAVKLFQMDIDYYNAANPTKPYIWRVPTQAEFQTLSTYLGGDAVSGGHLKEIGLYHWLTPNTGADNSSGFSALGGGIRKSDGIYSNRLNIITFSSFTIKDVNSRIWAPEIRYNDATFFTTSNQLLSTGCSLRLIKA